MIQNVECPHCHERFHLKDEPLPPTEQAPSEEQLRRWASHVNYEIRMLRCTYRVLSEMERGEFGPPEEIQNDTNMVLESFLIHIRNLRDFFQKEGGKKTLCVSFPVADALVASMFLGEKLDLEECRDAKHTLKKVYDELNKLLSHLSADRDHLIQRLRDKLGGWPPTLLLAAIRDYLECFRQRVATSNRGMAAWFDSLDGVLELPPPVHFTEMTGEPDRSL